MDQHPVILTRYAFTRILKTFAQRLGLSDVMADATAQVHLQTHAGAENWTAFLSENCAGCSETPDSCLFMNPTRESIHGGASIDNVKSATAMQIESGRMRVCPART